jgi:NADPH:quinone reductase-like Zn-dependent oxidoreductase
VWTLSVCSAPIGHEFIGIVEEIGDDVSMLSPGDLVIAPFLWCCGQCRGARGEGCRAPPAVVGFTGFRAGPLGISRSPAGSAGLDRLNAATPARAASASYQGKLLVPTGRPRRAVR